MDMEYNIKVMHAMRANFRFVELRGSHGAIHGCCTQPYPGYMMADVPELRVKK